ncbi:MAG TPA: energy transducer TonB [Blastocatellia bacterium]|nr:energy transducer TonB [Blastocatellia bacterium]
MLVSKLDAELPSSSFNTWFRRLIGPRAGVTWQLTECGGRRGQKQVGEQDLNACIEANAILTNGRQVILAIGVGTFKKGISGEPAFYSGVITQNDQFYQVHRLRDLPNLLRTPENPPTRLPNIASLLPRGRLYYGPAKISAIRLRPYRSTQDLTPPPPPPARTAPLPNPEEPKERVGSQRARRVREVVLQGRALVKVKPVYPPTAKSMNVSGSVAVQVVVSEDGHVINAKAVSGHPLLRGPAVDSARKWVFIPTTVNEVPVCVESVLTFVFK